MKALWKSHPLAALIPLPHTIGTISKRKQRKSITDGEGKQATGLDPIIRQTFELYCRVWLTYLQPSCSPPEIHELHHKEGSPD